MKMKNLDISQVDTVFANGSYPIEFLLFFKNTIRTKTIRAALKKIASDFWPFFGTYHAGKISFEKYIESECFEEKIVDAGFNLKDSNEAMFENFCQVNPDVKTRLFHVTVIQFKNGTVFIPKLNHLAGDGYSYFYFLSVLAAISQNKFVPFKSRMIRSLFKPHHRRTALKDFQFSETNLNSTSVDKKFTIEFEEIPKAHVRSALKNIAAQCELRVSTNDYLSALVFRKSVQLQNDFFGEAVSLTIPIDVRRYIAAFGKKFLGNAIMFHQLVLKKKNIIDASLEDLAITIRESMPTITQESYLYFLEQIEVTIQRKEFENLRPYNPETGCLVTNLSKMPADKLNFGTGNPDIIFPLTIEKNSAAVLSDNNNFVLRLAY